MENKLLHWHELDVPFADLADDNVPLAYEQSYSLVVFLVDRFGWHKIKELLERLGQLQAWQTAIDGTYQDYGLDWPAILMEWQASLNR